MNLSFLIILPLITAIVILFVKGLKQVRAVALTGSLLQLALVFDLMIEYFKEKAHNNAQMLFQYDYNWFPSLNIHYHVGVDGISVAMMLLTATIGGLVSCNVCGMIYIYTIFL